MCTVAHQLSFYNLQNFETTDQHDPHYQACPSCGRRTPKFLFCTTCLGSLVEMRTTESRRKC